MATFLRADGVRGFVQGGRSIVNVGDGTVSATEPGDIMALLAAGWAPAPPQALGQFDSAPPFAFTNLGAQACGYPLCVVFCGMF